MNNRPYQTGSRPEWVKEQYRAAGNLNARIALHTRFGTASRPWPMWVFDHFSFAGGARILEIGAGPGGLWANNRQRIPKDWQLVLTDLSPGMVTQAQRTLAALPQVRFSVLDAQALPFATAVFDGVVANHMLYHVPDRAVALAEIRRVLRPDGRFFAATNGRNHMHQLRTLAGQFREQVEEMPLAVGSGSTAGSFAFDDGLRELEAHFAHVTLHRYENELRVTDPGALVAYLLSGTPYTIAPERAGALRDFVHAELARHTPFVITNDTGLFEAAGLRV